MKNRLTGPFSNSHISHIEFFSSILNLVKGKRGEKNEKQPGNYVPRGRKTVVNSAQFSFAAEGCQLWFQ